jgi:undecaprenyl-diphosphatase
LRIAASPETEWPIVAIWALMRVLERYSAWPFVIYRGALGVVLLVGLALGWFV